MVGERLEDAPTPTPRQQQIQNGTVKISIQKIIPNITPTTAPAMVPAETDAVEYVDRFEKNYKGNIVQTLLVEKH